MDQINREQPFGDIRKRHAFVRKVVTIVALQLLATLAIFTPFTLVDKLRNFAKRYFWIGFIFLGVYILLWIILICFKNLRRKRPLNLILLLLFTICMGLAVGFICGYSKFRDLIFIAYGASIGFCVLLILFAWQCKFDFNSRAPYFLFILMVVVLLVVIGVAVALRHSQKIIGLVLSFAIVFIFSLFLISSIQILLRGNLQVTVDSNDYVLIVLSIYGNVMIIFIQVVKIMGYWWVC